MLHPQHSQATPSASRRHAAKTPVAARQGIQMQNHNETFVVIRHGLQLGNHNETVVICHGILLGNHNETLVAIRDGQSGGGVPADTVIGCSIVSNHCETVVRPASAA